MRDGVGRMSDGHEVNSVRLSDSRFLAQEPQTSDWFVKRICISFEVAGPKKKKGKRVSVKDTRGEVGACPTLR